MKPIWQTEDGAVRLYLGDCLEVLPGLKGNHCGACGHEWRLHLNTNACCHVVGKADDTEQFEGAPRYCLCDELPPPLVDAVVTDPPYGIFDRGGKWGRKSELQWDKEPAAGIEKLLDLAPDVIVWGGNYFPLPPSRGWLVWYKPDSVPSAADCELAWTSLNANTRLIKHSIAATNSERCGHPTQKPLAVMLFTLESIPRSISVLDPFMGSGTTGVACVRTGRRFIGIEKEPKYFEIAVKRIEDELNRAPLFEPKPQVQREFLK